MDVLTLQWWIGGSPVSGPTPPAPPIPSGAGDAAALVGDLISFGGGDPSRLYWRNLADPWAQIRAFMRQIVKVDEPEWHVNPEYLKAKQAHDVTIATRVSRITRCKKSNGE